MTVAARAVAARIGQGLIQAAIDAVGQGEIGPLTLCHGGREARRVQVRIKPVATMTGPVRVHRLWYHCTSCKHGFAPLDSRLGVAGTMSPALIKCDFANRLG